MSETKTVVVYGDAQGRANLCMLEEDLDRAGDASLSDSPVFLEKFEATSWGEAMTYYRKKYFNEVYRSEWAGVWMPFSSWSEGQE